MTNSWKESDIDLAGARMHVTRTGDGSQPALVLAHGFSDEGLCWQPTAEDLQDTYDVIMPDARAHGLSARVQPGQLVDQPADLLGVMDALGVRQAVVGGHSMGAALTARLAARFPERVRALILEDAPWWGADRPVRAPNAENPMEKMMRELCALPEDALLERCRRDHPTWSEIALQRWGEGKMHLDLNWFRTESADKTSWEETVLAFACPVLLITADSTRGGIITPALAEKAQQLNPLVRVANIPNAGHHVRFENYPAFMQAVRDFLKEI